MPGFGQALHILSRQYTALGTETATSVRKRGHRLAATRSGARSRWDRRLAGRVPGGTGVSPVGRAPLRIAAKRRDDYTHAGSRRRVLTAVPRSIALRRRMRAMCRRRLMVPMGVSNSRLICLSERPRM